MRNRFFSLILGALAALFILRVYAQLVQVSFQVDWMPEFDGWHSGMLPYPILFVFQLCIIGCMIQLMRAVRKDTIRPRRWKYRACFIFGGPYFVFTLFDWAAALAVLAEDPSYPRPCRRFSRLLWPALYCCSGCIPILAIAIEDCFAPLPTPDGSHKLISPRE